MPGGTFDAIIGKVRPGTYINIRPTQKASTGASVRGRVVVPWVGADYGPAKEFITVSAENAASLVSKLGGDVFTRAACLPIREALKNAQEVLVYRLIAGVIAQAVVGNLTVKAKYSGERGNAMKVVIVETGTGVFTVTVYLGTSKIYEAKGVGVVADLPASEWLDFTGTGAITATAGANLAGGTNGTQANTDVTDMLDAVEMVAFNTLAFPFTEADLLTAAVDKVKYFREEIGKYVRFVLPGKAADYIGIINVTNGVKLADGTTLAAKDCTPWIAGADAGAGNVATNTYKEYVGAVDVNGRKTNEESITANEAGEYFFTTFEGAVVVENDINCLVTLGENLDASFRDNTVVRTLDAVCTRFQRDFRPGKYRTNKEGFDLADAQGKIILREFETSGAIENVDYDADFTVDRAASTGSSMYITVGIQPAQYASKIYITIITR